MKILIYGGCHASALKRIFDKYVLGNIEIDTLINYRLIASGEPFPYDRLAQYDCILFNPILSKAEYNTIQIENFCKLRGIRFFKYPWLQWGGYWPVPKKRTWGNSREWGLLHLKDHAENYLQPSGQHSIEQRFEAYYESLFDSRNFRDLMEQELEKTTRQLSLREQEGRVDFKISSFIKENFRKNRSS